MNIAQTTSIKRHFIYLLEPIPRNYKLEKILQENFKILISKLTILMLIDYFNYQWENLA